MVYMSQGTNVQGEALNGGDAGSSCIPAAGGELGTGPATDCPLCSELQPVENTPLQRMLQRAAPERHLYANKVVTVLPDMAPVTEGHLLLTTNRHVFSYSYLTAEERAIAWKTLEALHALLEPIYGPVAFFEHGSTSGTRRRGACIDHAHIHIIPTHDKQFEECISGYMGGPPEELRGLSGLAAYAGEAYLMYGSTERICVWRPPLGTASQVIRKVCWEQFGNPDHWDWAIPADSGAVSKTISTLSSLRDLSL